MATWWTELNGWLLSQGWDVLLAASAIIIAVTVYLIVTRQAALLAAWLVWLYLP